jgi:hypothetical protein
MLLLTMPRWHKSHVSNTASVALVRHNTRHLALQPAWTSEPGATVRWPASAQMLILHQHDASNRNYALRLRVYRGVALRYFTDAQPVSFQQYCDSVGLPDRASYVQLLATRVAPSGALLASGDLQIRAA